MRVCGPTFVSGVRMRVRAGRRIGVSAESAARAVLSTRGAVRGGGQGSRDCKIPHFRGPGPIPAANAERPRLSRRETLVSSGLRRNTEMAHMLPRMHLPGKPKTEKLDPGLSFFDLFRVIEEEQLHCFLLESLDPNNRHSRYSVIGFDPLAVIRGRPGTLMWESTRHEVRDLTVPCENPYHALRDWFPTGILSRNYAGGLVGTLGYDAAVFFEPSLKLKQHEGYDPFVFGLYLDGLVCDTMTGEIFYYTFGEDRSSLVKEYMRRSPTVRDVRVRYQGDSIDEPTYLQMVRATQEEIRAGNTFQCQIGLQRNYEITGSSVRIYERLREVSPSPFMFYMKFGDVKQIGASPELVFRLQQGEMETYPLAGTTGRGKTEDEDVALARALLNDPKEIAEHNMLVDLHRNDLGRVARFGTVKVRHLMDIRKFSHVQHISSEVVGILARDRTMFDGLASCFPAGTLSGAPKIESMKIIQRLEGDARGPYGGAVGQFGFNGNATFTIPIRTLFISGTQAFARASAGIVFDSVPENEYAEIGRKLAAMDRCLKEFLV